MLLVIKIAHSEGLARLLYKPREGESMPKPVAQPGMVYGSGNRVVEGVYFKNRTWKHAAYYWYHISGNDWLLHESLIVDPRWPDNATRPDFVEGMEYSIDVELIGRDIKAVVQVQTSFSRGAQVILYSENRNELYAVRKTTLEKMLEKQKARTHTDQLADLHMRTA